MNEPIGCAVAVSAVNSPRPTPSSSSALNSPLGPTLVSKMLCSPAAAIGSTSESAHSFPACIGSGGRVWKASAYGTTMRATNASTRTHTLATHRARRKGGRIRQGRGREWPMLDESGPRTFFPLRETTQTYHACLAYTSALPFGCLSTIRNA